MKYILNFVVILSFSCTLISCNDDFLTTTSPSQLPEKGFFNSSKRAKLGINAAYSVLASNSLYADYLSKIYTGSSGDAIISNTTGTEFSSFSYNPADAILMSVYSELYKGVYRANVVLKNVPQIDMDKNVKKRILGQAKFLRAFYYFHLTTLWGEVPLITKPFKKPSDALKAKSPVKDIYSRIIDDLKDAVKTLPISYQGANVGRATKGAAEALLGKVYLYNKDYQDAYNWLNKVLNLKVYSLMDDYNHIWNRNYENNKESIFEVQFKQVGSQDVENLRDWYDAPQGPPGGFGNDQPNQNIVDAYEQDSKPSAIHGRDPRLFYTIFRDGDPYIPSSKDAVLGTFHKGWTITGYAIKKGMVPVRIINQGSGTNFPVIRYAGVLLMYAEAANDLGKIKIARDYVDSVRMRPSVDMPPLKVSKTNTKEKMFDAIVHERRVELAFEFQRYNDLRRWGLAQKVLGPLGYTKRDRYFPLPQNEIDVNPKLKQRPGW